MTTQKRITQLNKAIIRKGTGFENLTADDKQFLKQIGFSISNFVNGVFFVVIADGDQADRVKHLARKIDPDKNNFVIISTEDAKL